MKKSRNVVDAATIEAARAALRDVPPMKPSTFSKRDAVISLKKEIEAMRKKGYTWSDVSDKLREVGLDVAAASVRSYMSEPSKTKAVKKGANGKNKDDEAEAIDLAAMSVVPAL